jgi:3-phenylpropionate/trans-cinnamate dioxygenase ferredoxin subunit
MTATARPAFELRRYVGPRVSDVPVGGRYIGEFGGKRIGILNVAGKFHAFLDRCPHLGGPLCHGDVIGLVYSTGPGEVSFDPDRKMLTCPWHGWEFDLATGQSYWNPNKLRVRPVPVEVENGERVAAELTDGTVVLLTKGPYVAETFDVTVDSDYLVVTVREPREQG